MVAGIICDVIDSSHDVNEKIRAVVTNNAAVVVALGERLREESQLSSATDAGHTSSTSSRAI